MSRVLINLLCFAGCLVIYAVYCFAIYGRYGSDFEEQGKYALIVAGVSFFFAMVWFIMGAGEWLSHGASRGAWLTWWWVMVAVVLISAGVLGLVDAAGASLPLSLPCAFLSYYLCTATFSPAGTEYIVPGSRVLRSLWERRLP